MYPKGKCKILQENMYYYSQRPLNERKKTLADAHRLQQFNRDVDDELDWIREKEPIAGSTNRGERTFY